MLEAELRNEDTDSKQRSSRVVPGTSQFCQGQKLQTDIKDQSAAADLKRVMKIILLRKADKYERQCQR
ncbi:hypothetical protein HKBW3S09_00815 [Candidatus Hakubella thermalkaliphila]|uniref:Uncharacterized protein n=1 Tax=Candidatus Hakubella thermalkaliphila TaxID=2754717 RepID=A0A6V8NSL7_9ACTN|nr:hypothetical protein [Actinomycetota bacterium]GFP23348.1 hypothetical protein HKBW3S09_00815 [Candidatus Hakubella thermalkaliphila]GFP31021.1 hypothetical protein HKBW3S34_01940 [Candidatus Hakubella thermalkaliphila]GFP39745.1 hypothetical protein HKBW3S47_01443 [Candidatus Hakubella thermalkaliphila]